jgi:hypothetical protein
MNESVAIALVVILLLLVSTIVAGRMSERRLKSSAGLLRDDAASGDGVIRMKTTSAATPEAQAAAIENALAGLPNVVRNQVQHVVDQNVATIANSKWPSMVRVNTTVKMVFKVPTKEVADALAATERALGMEVEVTAPSGVDADGKPNTVWLVNSRKL